MIDSSNFAKFATFVIPPDLKPITLNSFSTGITTFVDVEEYNSNLQLIRIKLAELVYHRCETCSSESFDNLLQTISHFLIHQKERSVVVNRKERKR
jgi:hypothetical protein